MRTFVTLETSRLYLRDYLSDDWRSVHEYAIDPEVYRFQPWGPNTEDNTRQFIKLVIRSQREKPRTAFELALVERANGQQIGGIGLRIQSQENSDADIGYVLRRDRWGQGLMTEAVIRMLEFGFSELHLHRIWATVAPDNLGSIRVLEKAGLKREGLMRKNLKTRGIWRDSYLYAILEEDPRPK